jgi:hypothetical protein
MPLRPAVSLVTFITALAVILSIAPIAAQDESASSPFGAIEAFWLPEEACAIGVGWDRIIFDWAEHQPTGPDDWHTLNVDDRWLAAARACGREVVAVIKHTPAWATDGTPLIGVPRGLDLPVDDPGNLWARFLRRAAEYYAPRGVNRFIIWNEPDIPAGVYGYEFEGSVAEYAQMLRVAYHALRAGNPDARIHLAGTTYWHDVNAGRPLYVERLLDVLAADPDAPAHGWYFDVLTLHIYFRVETITPIVSAMRAVLARYGLAEKAIWIAETNASPNLDPLWPVTRPRWQIDLDQQAAFLLQAAALGLAARVERIGVYKFYDWSIAPGAESFALIRHDRSRRPAFDTWALVIDQFSSVVEARLGQTDTVDVVHLRRADGAHLLAAWARTADAGLLQVTVGGAEPAARLYDLYGNMVQIAPADGVYTLILPGARCSRRDGCPVGGLPALLALPTAPDGVRDALSGAELQFE